MKRIIVITIFVIACICVMAVYADSQKKEMQITEIVQMGICSEDNLSSNGIVTGLCNFGDCPVEKKVTTTVDASETNCENTEKKRDYEDADYESYMDQTKNDTTEEFFDSVTYSYIYEQYDSYAIYSAKYFCEMGEIYWGGWKWTWYSERVLPGGGLHIPGRYTDDYDGYVRDADGYICLASDDYGRGTVIDTPFGSPGKVYDQISEDGRYSGCLDVYVGW